MYVQHLVCELNHSSSWHVPGSSAVMAHEVHVAADSVGSVTSPSAFRIHIAAYGGRASSSRAWVCGLTGLSVIIRDIVPHLGLACWRDRGDYWTLTLRIVVFIRVASPPPIAYSLKRLELA